METELLQEFNSKVQKLRQISDMIGDYDLCFSGKTFESGGWVGSVEYSSEDGQILVGRAKAVKENANFDFHIHPKSLEILVLLSGDILILQGVDSYRLNSALQFIIIEPEQEHNTKGKLGSELIFIQIPADDGFLLQESGNGRKRK